MISRATKGFWKAYRELPNHVRTRAREVYRLWLRDPWHPTLLSSGFISTRQIYSVRWRLKCGMSVCAKHEGHFIWFWIGSHADYDIIRFVNSEASSSFSTAEPRRQSGQGDVLRNLIMGNQQVAPGLTAIAPRMGRGIGTPFHGSFLLGEHDRDHPSGCWPSVPA